MATVDEINVTDIDKMSIALNYYKNNKITQRWFESRYKNKVYDHMRVIYNMSLHPRLAKYFCTIPDGGQRFAGITDAIRHIRKQNDPKLLLVNYKELDMYGVHTPTELSYFINTLVSNIFVDNDPSDNIPFITLNCNIDQCIFDHQAQKTVFTYNDKDTLEVLSGYVKEFLDCNVCIVETGKLYEITIQKLNDTKIEADQLYKNLKDHVFERDDIMGNHMSPLCQKGSDINRPYTVARLLNVTNDTSDITLDKIIELSKTSPVNITIVNNVVNNVVNNINNGNINNTINNATDRRKDVVINWIRTNPPNNLEKTTDYYSRYITNNIQGCANNKFGELMKKEGYNIKRLANGRYWIGK